GTPARAGALVRPSREFLEASGVNAAAGGRAPVDLGASAFQSITQVRAAADNLRLPWWTITPFDGSAADAGAAAAGAAPARPDGGGGGGGGGGPGASHFQNSERGSGRAGRGGAPAGRGRAGWRGGAEGGGGAPAAAAAGGVGLTCAGGWRRAGGWCSSARDTARPSGWLRCCAARASGRGSASWTARRSRGCRA